MIRLAFILSLVLPLVGPVLAFAEKDEVSAIQGSLGDFFGIYMLRKDKRSKEDTVVVKKASKGGYIAEISYWRSLKSRDPVEEICNAYKWMLFGRGTYGKGAAEAFNQFSTLAQINLRFFDVEFTTKVGKKSAVLAHIEPTQRVIPFLRIGLTRQSLAKKNPDWASVKTQLDKGQCAQVGKNYLDLSWFDRTYLREGQ